ncbi:hypothetical protein Taro_022443 [Colocasia esculenta]|uniref:Uncharacterized protein n=1 Tax=Colocasia esculenta TaxID=4460 RepID=A0A843VEG8_COLES|nr:hypothetical protein [Colocasia esculenta]
MVSLPANIKFTVVSLRNFLDSTATSTTPARRFKYELSMVSHAITIFFSSPARSHLRSFQNPRGTVWRKNRTSSASSMALAKGTTGRPGERHPRSTPNTCLHVASKLSLRKMSCRSTADLSSAARARRGRSPLSTLSRLVAATNRRNPWSLMSACAALRWLFHESWSALKMPSPRMSNISRNSSPLG